MHKKEIDKISKLLERQGYTLAPLKVYFKKGRAKMLIGVARGKKAHDKRETLKQADHQREMDRARRAR